MQPKSKKLRIAHRYANGLQHKTNKLIQYMQNIKIDVMTVCETDLKSSKTPKIPNYDTIRADRQIQQWGGIILIKKTIKYQLLPNVNDGKLETTRITVQAEKENLHL